HPKRKTGRRGVGPMSSAVIADYQYNATSQILKVRYHSGKIYQYLDVPEKVFKEMRSTMVKTIWFNRHNQRKYSFREVTPGLNQGKLFS
ncbi:MAG TPA: KTSC domain-containing protein, partial [Mucilaginibacter sp.]